MPTTKKQDPKKLYNAGGAPVLSEVALVLCDLLTQQDATKSLGRIGIEYEERRDTRERQVKSQKITVICRSDTFELTVRRGKYKRG